MSGGIEIEGFQYVKTLGRGGFATTYLFSDLKNQYGRYVAVKVPHDKDREEPLIRGDIISLATLRDVPSIAKILDIKRVGDRYVLLMEYIQGPLLRHLLGLPGTGARLSLEKALHYTFQVAKGLEAAQRRQMVHRDIKPENIIIEEKTDQAKILDFGMASLIGTKGFFETQYGGHTPFYTPAEVLVDFKGDHRVDIYSLGVTLYEMLTGTLPYFEPQMTLYRLIERMRKEKPVAPRNINPRIPLYVELAIMKAISYQPENRFQDMRSFIRALEPPPELKAAHDHLAIGSVRRAEHVLRALLERCPQDSRGYLALANLLNRCHKPAEAGLILNQAIELDPHDPVLHLRLGVTLLEMGKKNDALASLARAESHSTDKHTLKTISALRAKAGSKPDHPSENGAGA